MTAIGDRLAEGPELDRRQAGVVESLGGFTRGAINVAADAVAAPTEIADPTLQEKSVDTAEQLVTLDKQ